MLSPSSAPRRPPRSAAATADEAGMVEAVRNAEYGEGQRAGERTIRTPSRWRRALLFARNFLRHPLEVGTLFESSPALVRRLADSIDWSRCRSVAELGPGVGTVTEQLLQRLPPAARLIAVERNPDFVDELRRSLPDRRLKPVHGSAAELPALLQRHGIAKLDAAISGIPFSTMPVPLRRAIVDSVADALSPDGEFVVYQHSTKMLPLLQERFADVSISTEWRNPVPMRVMRCREPMPRLPVAAG